MVFSQVEEFEKLSLKPDNMADDELLEISLHTLTKQLAPTLAPASVVITYVQWLDVHCIRGSAMTYHWANTIQQWVHALRSLGFSASNIIVGLDQWRMMHRGRRFTYSQSRSMPHPTEVELFHAFDNVQSYHPGSRVEFGGRAYAHDHLAVPPPPAYVCNRCGVPGHHLQMCPTNLNPAYDQAPASNYSCTICHMTGDHYRSLCPLNCDPSSLNQQRLMAGINRGGHLQRQYIVNGPVPEHKVQVPRGVKRGRPLTSSPHSRSSHEGSPTPEKKQESLRKRMRRIEVYEEKLAKGKKLDPTQAEMVRKKADIQRELNALVGNHMGGYHDEHVVHDDGSIHHEATRIYNSGFELSDNVNIGRSMPVTPYSEFTQKLIECQREEMTQTVNFMKPRPTALEKWELLEADNRDVIAMAVTGMDVTYDPFLNEDIFHETLAAAAAEYCEPPYPSIYGPEYKGGELPVINSIFDHIPIFGTLHKNHKTSKSGSGSSLLVDDKVIASGPLTPLLAPSLQAQVDAFYPKNFNPIIMPPKETKKFNKHADLKFGSGDALNNFLAYYEAHGSEAFGEQESSAGRYAATNKAYGHASSNSVSSSSSLLGEDVSVAALQTPLLPKNIQDKKAVFYPKTFTVPIIGPVPKMKKRVPKDITNIMKKETKKEQSCPSTRAYAHAMASETANVEAQYI